MAKNNSNIPLSVVGKSVPIKDAREKVTGSLKYGVDFQVPNMVYGKILRSPHAHAKIRGIDYSRAEALSGVLGVICYQDAPDLDWNSCWFNYRGHILDDRARFVGDEVAACLLSWYLERVLSCPFECHCLCCPSFVIR